MRLALVPCVFLALALSLPVSAAEVKLLSSVAANRASGTASGPSRVAALSADGRWVLFSSEAPNLLPGIVDENGGNDVFLHDRVAGETILVSRSVEDESRTAGGLSTATSISADGRVGGLREQLPRAHGPDELRGRTLMPYLKYPDTSSTKCIVPGRLAWASMLPGVGPVRTRIALLARTCSAPKLIVDATGGVIPLGKRVR